MTEYRIIQGSLHSFYIEVRRPETFFGFDVSSWVRLTDYYSPNLEEAKKAISVLKYNEQCPRVVHSE